MYRLNGASGDKTGLGIALKVMTGDTVSIFGKSFWHSNGSGTSNSYTTVVNDLLTALAGTSAVANAGKGATAGSLTGSAVTPGDVSNLLSTEPTTSGRPNAYINWILFDEQFRVVSSNSGFDPINSSADVLKTHSQSVNISKSGYLYVYVSNESNQDVFFDNLQVIHARGPLLEETHYYPFGLTMAGISSKAAGKLENKKNKFQGQEYNDDLGVDMYEFKYRMDDPQTGRFWQVDPLADKYVYNSTYAFSENHVTSHVELEGLEKFPVNGEGSGDPAKLPKALQSKNAQMVASKNAGELAASKAASSEPTKNEKGKPQSGQGNAEVGNVGSTVTTKIGAEANVLNSGLGDKLAVSSYTGVTAGEEGKIVTTDAATMNGKPEGGTVTVGPLTLGYGTDASVSVGISAFGVEGHVSLGVPKLLPQIGLGGSYTSKNKTVKGGDVKAQIGLGTAVAFFVAPAAIAAF